MAKRKSVAKKASRKSTPARRPAAKASKGRGAAKAARKQAAKRSVAKKAAKKVARKAAKKAAAKKVVARKAVKAPTPVKKAAASKSSAPKASKAARPKKAAKAAPGTDRTSIPSSLGLDERTASAAKSGRRAQRTQLKSHTETSPALTGGDVDANWEEAYASGDEAPGGDNPTPDQDRVDEIGHALGVEYEDNEELKGADKIAERDKHRWELNPASSDDYRERS